MRKPFLVAALAVLATWGAGPAAAIVKDTKPKSADQGEAAGGVVLKLRSPAAATRAARGDAPSGVASVMSRNQARVTRRLFPGTRSATLQKYVFVRSSRTKPEEVAAFVGELRRLPEVESAEPDRIVSVQSNDPFFSSSSSWGQPFQDLWGLHKVAAPAVWARTRGAGAVVAVVDTGLDFDHEDIAANVATHPGEIGLDGLGRDKRSNRVDDDGNGYVDDWRGFDFTRIGDGVTDNDASDDHGHGTHVSGTIAAVADNGMGIAGVAPDARILALKCLSRFGGGLISDCAEAVVYAADNGAHVVNLSVGGRDELGHDVVFKDAVEHAHDVKGVVVVAAAGNGATDVGGSGTGFGPANLRDVITVAAFDHHDVRAFFSNVGAKVDVSAPGGGGHEPPTDFWAWATILSLLSRVHQPEMTGFGGELAIQQKYARVAGTSMAAPHVSGVAALVRALHPSLSPEQVRQAIRRGADDVAAPGRDLESGYGRVNAAGAVAHAVAPLAMQVTDPWRVLTATSGVVDVLGQAFGPGFSRYEIEYGRGLFPTSWTRVASSTTPVTQGRLATWDSATIPDGTHTLRGVAVSAAGDRFEDRMTVVVDNIEIVEPAPSEIHEMYSPQGVTVVGTVAPGPFSHFTLLLRSLTRGDVPDARITVTDGGRERITNGVLGTWDSTGLSPDHYELVVRVFYTDGSHTDDAVRFVVDFTAHAAWPPTTADWAPSYYALHDVDGDGDSEIVWPGIREMRVLNHDGSPAPGWPQPMDDVGRGAAVGDITGDGKPEIVTADRFGMLYAWHRDGTLVEGYPLSAFPSPMGPGVDPHVAIADINNDGAGDIVVTDNRTLHIEFPAGGTLKVFDRFGLPLAGWTRHFTEYIGQPSIGDLDNDGQKEIVVVTPVNIFDGDELRVYVLDGGGVRAGWPKTFPGGATHAALGDLDRDSDLEIVFGDGVGRVHALHHDGSSLVGWPVSTPHALHMNSPVLGDVDGDGRLEVFASSRTRNAQMCDCPIPPGPKENRLFGWRSDGTPLPGWPVLFDLPMINGQFGFGTPILADVDGDRRVDIVSGNDAVVVGLDGVSDAPMNVVAYKLDGTKVAGFPKPTWPPGQLFSAFPSSPAVADLDGDGRRELVWLSNTAMRVWDVSARVSSPAPWPAIDHDARKTSVAAPPTTRASRRARPIVVDGNLDEEGWSITHRVVKHAQGAPNNTVTYGVSWDDNNLYVGVQVLDAALRSDSSNVRDDDAVEVFIDADHDRSVPYDSDDRYFAKGWRVSSLWEKDGRTTGVRHAWAAIPGGYSVELLIPWARLEVAPKAGVTLGFDVGCLDDDDGGLVDHQQVWSGTAANFKSTFEFGDLVLVP